MTTASVSHLSAIVSATADAVADDAAKAHVVFRAKAQAHDAVASTVALGKYTVEVDEPPALGGDNAAPNPVEYYLASLLSCHVVTYRFWAERLGIRVDDIKAVPRATSTSAASSGSTTTSAPGSVRCASS